MLKVKRMSPLAVLKACSLFKGFTDTGLQIIAGIAAQRTFPKGAPLFVENMVGDSMFVLSEGKVSISSKNGSGQEVQLGDLGPGEALGELSLLQVGQRMCTASAASEVTALEIRHADLQKLLAQKPQACVKLLMSISSGFGQKILENRGALKMLLPATK